MGFLYTAEQLQQLASSNASTSIDEAVLHLCQATGILRRKRYMHRGSRRSFTIYHQATEDAIPTLQSRCGSPVWSTPVGNSAPRKKVFHQHLITIRTMPVTATAAAVAAVATAPVTAATDSTCAGSGREANLCRVNLSNCGPFQERHEQDSSLVKFAVLNARSVSNKAFILNDRFTSHHLDFLFITESWLSGDDIIALGDLCPAHCSFLNSPRVSGRGGGLITVFKNSFKCRIVP
ncbi:hypothetical protein AALO_G00075460, partial [Alosa alosa]